MTAPSYTIRTSFYKEHQGIDHLSKTFQSNLAFSPGDTGRRTASLDNFHRQRNKDLSWVPKTPWGRKWSYGGMGPVCLPDDRRPKTEPPYVVQKGHRHLSAGVCVHPSTVSIDEKYDLTSLKRSNLRVTDELVEAPTKVDVNKHSVHIPFPAEHPYATHIPRSALFPPYEPSASVQSPKSVMDTPKSGAEVDLKQKPRGSGYRHEEITPTIDTSKQKPLQWLEGPNFFHLKRTSESRQYYPIPPKSLDPNMKVERSVALETDEALKQLKSSHSLTTYGRDLDHAEGTEAISSSIAENVEDGAKETEEDESGNMALSEGKQTLVHFAKTSPTKSLISASYPPFKQPTQDREIAHANYVELIRGWSRSDIRRKFNRIHSNDNVPDLRRKPDLRITTNERRHHFPELGNAGSYVMNGLSLPYRKGIVT